MRAVKVKDGPCGGIMRAVKIKDGPCALVVQEVDNGYETTVGWVPYENAEPITDCQGVLATFIAEYSQYLPTLWPQLKFFDSELKPGYLKEVLTVECSKPYIFTDNRQDSQVSCVCPIDIDWPDNNKNQN